MKVAPIQQPSDFQFMIFCPGCKCGHGLRVGQKEGSWEFNGDMEKPTFSPSLLVEHYQYPERDPETKDFKRGPDGKYLLGPDKRLLGGKKIVCHSYIEEGNIRFLDDCTHELAGKTVPLPDFEGI